jgi:ATP-dependent DNA ligase
MTNYPIQKVLHYHLAKEKKNFKITSEYAISEKLDGWYVYLDYIDNKWRGFKSSGSNIIPALDHLIPKLKNFTPKNNTRFIFEGTIPRKGIYEVNSALKRQKEDALNIILNLHDVIELDNPWLAYITRSLSNIASYSENLSDVLENRFKLIETLEITKNEEVFLKHFNEITSRNGEGIVLKKINAGYSFGKKNSDVMKIKEEVTEECIVVNLVKGENKYSDTTGALVVKRANGVYIQVSGMTDKQREEWWEDKTSIIGKTVEIKAMKELPDGTLREPRFKFIREDR